MKTKKWFGSKPTTCNLCGESIRDVEKEEKRLEEELGKKILDYDWRRLQFDKQEAKLKSEIVRLEIKLNRLKDEADTFIDGSVKRVGSWAIMCQECHKEYGVGLGLGLGQLYHLKDGEWLKVEG